MALESGNNVRRGIDITLADLNKEIANFEGYLISQAGSYISDEVFTLVSQTQILSATLKIHFIRLNPDASVATRSALTPLRSNPFSNSPKLSPAGQSPPSQPFATPFLQTADLTRKMPFHNTAPVSTEHQTKTIRLPFQPLPSFSGHAMRTPSSKTLFRRIFFENCQI
jgi:hypothetical protein